MMLGEQFKMKDAHRMKNRQAVEAECFFFLSFFLLQRSWSVSLKGNFFGEAFFLTVILVLTGIEVGQHQYQTIRRHKA